MSFSFVPPSDKYSAEDGYAFLSGTQALVRLPLMQHRLDQANKLNTAGYISGYRGSPLGRYDTELERVKPLLAENNIVFQPGVNEDLAATAIWGSQQAGLFPGAKYDGVFSIWYGKGPGVDRSGDAFKHANLAGTSPHGGVLLAFGDDHSAKSSTLAHQSEQALIAAMMPILHPSSVAEIIEYGLFGWALSRYAGVWIGLKCVTDIVESAASIDLAPPHSQFNVPSDIDTPPGGVHVRMGFEPVEAERRLLRHKLPMALAFARANPIDKIIWDPKSKRLGIVCVGKAYNDGRQALERLGIDRARAEKLGLGLYKVGMPWPLEPSGFENFAAGYQELLIIEEKRSIVEDQAARILFNMNAALRPRIVGKVDSDGKALLASDGVLSPHEVAGAIAERLEALGLADQSLRLAATRNAEPSGQGVAANFGIARLPYFCSGCPHNSSTKVPEGSQAMAGIGCSYMAVWMDRDTVTSVQMGAEGTNWNGIAPFTETPHVFQNLGDGTYFHSGLMAIRATVAAGVNITYKILFNDAVAMTGGQSVDGPLSVPQITRQVHAEGVAAIIVLSDEPEKYGSAANFAPGVEVHSRDDLDLVQKRLRETKGTTVLIYDQTCAAEKRRRRKTKTFPDPPKRAFINAAVCEGCGDCSAVSNCVSILPRETEFGRKRMIDQSSCNKDFSCVKGFCPSFVTVHGGQLRRPDPLPDLSDKIAALPEPQLQNVERPYSIVIAGIGGAGVVTVGSILSLAAHIAGKGVTTFDMTGLAQKNGAVMTHIKVGASQGSLHSPRIFGGEADLLLACDVVASSSGDVMPLLKTGKTRAVANSHMTPTGHFQIHGDIDFRKAGFIKAIRTGIGAENMNLFDATALAQKLTGDSIATNLLMLGYASQRGLLPVSPAMVEKAIDLNGRGAENQKRIFNLGRLAAHSPQELGVPDAFEHAEKAPPANDEEALDIIIAQRAAFLQKYQDERYAKRFTSFVNTVRSREAEMAPGSTTLTNSVARALSKLMAYKDEYEVARLFTNGDFAKDLNKQFEGKFKLHFHMAPPLFAPRDKATGQPRKLEFGPWVLGGLRILARMKRLRGTPFDIFGYTRERKDERGLISRYMSVIASLLDNLSPDNIEAAATIAGLPEKIRGYGHVKLKNMEAVAKDEEVLLERFFSVPPETGREAIKKAVA